MSGLYRKNVGIVLCKQGKVLLFARADLPDLQWQFPQGGIEKNEDILAAAKRELLEETGITSLRLLALMPEALRYDFPKDVAKKWQHGSAFFGKTSFVGQEQHWVLFEFLGADAEINFLTNPQEVEFKSFKWADISEAVKDIVFFKKDVYQKVSDYFSPYIRKTAHD